jgi:hypothetical protein
MLRTTESSRTALFNMPRVPAISDQRALFEVRPAVDNAASSTFLDNLSLPIHRWFRYSAGFSGLWARELISREKQQGRRTIFDPFAGSGTVVLEAEYCGVEGRGVEAHPFIARVAQAKLGWRVDPDEFQSRALDVLNCAKQRQGTCDGYPPLILKCYAPDTLQRLDALRRAVADRADDSASSPLIWLALVSILRACSPVGTAQWQYVLPRKSKAGVVDPFVAFQSTVQLMWQDMQWRQRQVPGEAGSVDQDDARWCSLIGDGWADLIVTSPPYANNYDYADATRLEMSFLGEVSGWGGLQQAVRRHLIRSCTQHVASEKPDLAGLLADPVLGPICAEITQVCRTLESEREAHGGKKPYHLMVAGYFVDLARFWIALRRVASEGALACFVVGDSAPYGVYVPVERWLGELALAAGFHSFRFEKTRDRNIKWKNRKHRVPLHEGRLWVQG